MSGAYLAEIFAKGEIPLQYCPGCKSHQSFARSFCVACLRASPEWRLAAGSGTVVSGSLQFRGPTDQWRERAPWPLAVVALSEGPRVMALTSTLLTPGTAVVLRPGGLYQLPCFEPMESECLSPPC